MKKRAREPHPEAPVSKDDGEEEDGSGGARIAASRPRLWSYAAQPQVPDLPTTNLAGSCGTEAERHAPLDIEMAEIGSDDNSAVVSAYELRQFGGSKTAGSQPEGGQFQKSENSNESKQNSLDKGKAAAEEQAERGGKTEPKTEQKRANRTTESKMPFPLPPAALLHPVTRRQDAELHSVLEKQAALLVQPELSVRVDAVSRINQLAELIWDRRTRKFVADAVRLQLWKEEEVSMVHALVNTMCSVALAPCVEDPEGGDDDDDAGPAQEAACVLFEYICAEEARAAPLKAASKVQILRSLYKLGAAGPRLEIGWLGPLAKEQLSSSNPRLREWGVRLLVQSIEERNGEDSGRVGAESSEHFQKNRAEGDSLMQTLQEHTRDPYPNVREAVVWGILELYGKGFELKHNTYTHAVALLGDSFESVRIWAMKLVGLCVRAAAWDSLEGPRSNYVDNAFLQICNMMTDMIMSVRREACNILAEMTGVSDSVLLQSLTKKVLTTSVTETESAARDSYAVSDGDLGVANPEENKVHDWSAAGAFVVGLEDEFWEVRSAAIKALERLGISSEKVARGVLELMVDMINDDSSQVRLQTIEALASLGQASHLSVHEDHLHMFTGIMEDSNVVMRRAGHYLLSAVSFPTIASFKLIIHAILESVKKIPQDEASVLVALRKLGQSHSSHTECIASELVQELNGLLGGDSGLDEPRCACMLMLLLGAATVNGKILSLIPSDIISIATVGGRKLPISLPNLRVLSMGVMTLQYAWPERDEIRPFEQHYSQPWSLDSSKHLHESMNMKKASNEGMRHEETDGTVWTFENNKAERDRPWQTASIITPEEGHRKCWVYQSWHQHVLAISGQIVASAVGSSPLLDIKAFKQVLQRLSQCRKELKALKGRCSASSGPLAFYGLYLQSLTFLVELRASVVASEIRHHVKRPGSQQEILSELSLSLKHLLHRFSGFQPKQLSQVMDLHTIVSVWRLALHPRDFVNSTNSPRLILDLRAAVTAAEKLAQKEDLPPSSLVKSVRQQLLPHLIEGNETKVVEFWRTARHVALSYWPCPMMVDSSVTVMWADMNAPGCDFDHPVRFITGLPLGIPVDVTAYNVPKSYSLWVRCIQGTSSAARYRLLDVEAEVDKASVSGVRRLSTLLRFDELPCIVSSVCRICIVLEGPDHLDVDRDAHSTRSPKGCLVPLCTEREVHLVLVKETSGSRQLPPCKR